ncbi:MAG: DUF5615 family PIN-like protein [Akkermansiaceae bacterium]|jgi:predicted nuclease of predicted toxin-antitoxin system|nr:DUF5615 family PIN-like protein [Akkermansiaceae bacterium]MDP4897890.1 DUF5615 family PIN-like protein [Akkermansiaceae bacterium]MDP4996196.1 DUF5615 family PIN-like protein [Akkermansiaceae bacterium]
MKFLVDAQLPGTLAKWLRGRECDAVHVLECGMAQTDDLSIWEKSIKEERILVTKDEDFFIFATPLRIRGACYGCGWEIAGLKIY